MFLLLGAALSWNSPAESPVSAADFQACLTANLARVRSVRAEFEQTREFQQFGSRFTVSGFMAIAADGRFVWHVRAPLEYVCVVDAAGVFRQWDAESNTVLELAPRDVPWLGALSAGLRGMFKADSQALEKDFTVTALPAECTLLLTPRSGSLYAQSVTGVRLVFAADCRRLVKVRTQEKGGDIVTIEFKNIELDTPIPEETWQLVPAKKH